MGSPFQTIYSREEDGPYGAVLFVWKGEAVIDIVTLQGAAPYVFRTGKPRLKKADRL